MLLRAHARDGNSKAYSDRSANWQIAVRLSGRRNAVLRVVNAAVVVEIDPPVLLLHAHVSMVAFRLAGERCVCMYDVCMYVCACVCVVCVCVGVCVFARARARARSFGNNEVSFMSPQLIYRIDFHLRQAYPSRAKMAFAGLLLPHHRALQHGYRVRTELRYSQAHMCVSFRCF